MVLTRGAEPARPRTAILGTRRDDVQDADNTDSPWVDQSQTYTSHSSHQVFLREYDARRRPASRSSHRQAARRARAGRPTRLADGPGMATWAAIKQQAAEKLGLLLADKDVTQHPDARRRPVRQVHPRPARGLPQYVTDDRHWSRATSPTPVAGPGQRPALRHAVPDRHRAQRRPEPAGHRPQPGHAAGRADAGRGQHAVGRLREPAGRHLRRRDARRALHAGDGRVQREHRADRRSTRSSTPSTTGWSTTSRPPCTSRHRRRWLAALADVAARRAERRRPGLRRAALPGRPLRHRDGVPAPGLRGVRPQGAAGASGRSTSTSPDINPAIEAEFAHAVYRFGHSMLDDDRRPRRTRPRRHARPTTPCRCSTAFLNPPEYFNGGDGRHADTPSRRPAAIVMGSSDQVGNELDEFVTETLRNNLLGLPLDLPTHQHDPGPRGRRPAAERRAPADLRRDQRRLSWRRTPAGRTSVSTSSTRSR